MQIKKINNNKLKVILSSDDLFEKNIDIDSFLANSIESQDLFFEILDLAEEKYNFNIDNNKAVIEAISLDNNIFVLTITKLKSEFSSTYNKKNCEFFCFEDINNILSLYTLMKKNNISLSNIQTFKLFNKYYIKFKEDDSTLENIILEYSNLIKSSDIFEDILVEYGKLIKN